MHASGQCYHITEKFLKQLCENKLSKMRTLSIKDERPKVQQNQTKHCTQEHDNAPLVDSIVTSSWALCKSAGWNKKLTFSPSLKGGCPRYGQPLQRNASPSPHCTAISVTAVNMGEAASIILCPYNIQLLWTIISSHSRQLDAKKWVSTAN